MNLLTDKKTFIVAGLIGFATFAKAMGWIDSTVYDVIIGFLAPTGLATLKLGQINAAKSLQADVEKVVCSTDAVKES